MTKHVYNFVSRVKPANVAGLRVIEPGSYNVNGSVRDLFEGCAEYVGFDMRFGPGVDVLANLLNPELVKELGPADVVVCTELIEHELRWQRAIAHMKLLTKEGGLLILTTCRPGFPRHDFPSDYHRFTEEQLRAAFFDCTEVRCETWGQPGAEGIGIVGKPWGLQANPVDGP